MPQRGTVAWFLISVVVGLVAGGLAVLVVAAPMSLFTLWLVVAAVVAVVVARLNPEYWLRRLALASLGAAIGSGLLPSLAAWVKGDAEGAAGEDAAASGTVEAGLVIEASPWVTVVFARLGLGRWRCIGTDRLAGPERAR